MFKGLESYNKDFQKKNYLMIEYLNFRVIEEMLKGWLKH